MKSVQPNKSPRGRREALLEEKRASSCTSGLRCSAPQSLRMLLDAEWVLDKRHPVFVLTRSDQTAVVWDDGGVTLT